MKKLIFITAGLFIFSCQKQVRYQSVSWRQGDAVESLKKVEQQNWSEKKMTETILKDEKIVVSYQSKDGSLIDNSFLKKVYKLKNNKYEITSIEARFSENDPLPSHSTEPWDEEKALKKIKQLRSNFLNIALISTDQVLQEINGRWQPVLKVEFFDHDGEPWSVVINKNYDVSEPHREGSRFSERASAESHVFPMGPKLSLLTDIVLSGLNVQPMLSTSDVVVTSEADQKIMDLSQVVKFEPKDVRFDQVQAFFFLKRSIEWMKKTFSIQFSKPLEVVVHVGYPSKTNTAFYFQSKIRLGSGDDITYGQIPQDPSIISHESFHFLIDQVAALPFEGEGGSLNEAFADFFTCMMLERPRLAENAYLKAPFKRSLESLILKTEKNGGLYHDSQIYSGLMWEIAQKIGSEKTLAVAINTLKVLHRYSDFEDFEKQFLDNIEKNLSKEDQSTILAIMKKRGFNV